MFVLVLALCICGNLFTINKQYGSHGGTNVANPNATIINLSETFHLLALYPEQNPLATAMHNLSDTISRTRFTLFRVMAAHGLGVCGYMVGIY